MKKFWTFLSAFCLTFFAGLFLFNVSFAQNNSWGNMGTNPISILDSIADKANASGSSIQDTPLNTVHASQGFSNNKSFTITNTLNYFKDNIHPYIQWAVYIGFVVGTILIIYFGFKMVTNGLHNDGDLAKTKKNIMSVGIGVAILAGFYGILQIMLAVINAVFT